MIEVVLGLVGESLKLWNHKEKTKYQDNYLRLSREYWQELNKEDQDHSLLDNLEREINDLGKFLTQAMRDK